MTDEYQSIPVAEARAAVQSSGLLKALEGPQYLSPQSTDWRSYFKPDDDAEHPDFGRVTVTREGQAPREVVIPWDEYAAELALNDPNWAETRSQKPMAVFGAEIERHAYRVVFADVLGKIEAPRPKTAGVYSSQGDRTPDDRPAAGWDIPARDWLAEVKAVTDLPGLNKVDDEARAEGALAKVDGLQQAIMSRMLDLASAPKPKPKPAPRPPVTDKLAGQSPRRRRSKRSS